jgi:hypothetical protein
MNMYSLKTDQTPQKKGRKDNGKKALMFKYLLSFEIKFLLVTGSHLVSSWKSWISAISYTCIVVWTKQPALPH